jgi:hypothetical protein
MTVCAVREVLRTDIYERIDPGVTTVRVPLEGVTHETEIQTDMFANTDADGGSGPALGDGPVRSLTTVQRRRPRGRPRHRKRRPGRRRPRGRTTDTTCEETQTETATTTEDDGIIL